MTDQHNGDERPVVTPLGSALETARENCGLSMRQAAQRAKISLSWWRYVVAGGHVVHGTHVPVVPSADAVIAMATAVGLSVARALELAGFSAAAEMWRDERVDPQVRHDMADLIRDQDLTPEDVEAIYRVLNARWQRGDSQPDDDDGDNGDNGAAGEAAG